MRLDHVMVSNDMFKKAAPLIIDTDFMSKPDASDHAPVIAAFNNPTPPDSISSSRQRDISDLKDALNIGKGKIVDESTVESDLRTDTSPESGAKEPDGDVEFDAPLPPDHTIKPEPRQSSHSGLNVRLNNEGTETKREVDDTHYPVGNVYQLGEIDECVTKFDTDGDVKVSYVDSDEETISDAETRNHGDINAVNVSSEIKYLKLDAELESQFVAPIDGMPSDVFRPKEISNKSLVYLKVNLRKLDSGKDIALKAVEGRILRATTDLPTKHARADQDVVQIDHGGVTSVCNEDFAIRKGVQIMIRDDTGLRPAASDRSTRCDRYAVFAMDIQGTDNDGHPVMATIPVHALIMDGFAAPLLIGADVINTHNFVNIPHERK